MIKVLNQKFELVAILENAYDIGYEKKFNELWKAKFSLPLDDEKNKECKSLYFVEITDEDEYIGLFRIIPSTSVKNDSKNEVNYQLEHVLATLLDKILFLYNEAINLKTSDVLQFLLNKQEVKHWKLGKVDFVRYFSYKWENENLLSALFSIPKTFDVSYQWTWDTTSYPFTLNLVNPELEVACEIRNGKNQRSIELEIDPSVIYNRIYPLGYGEGDNQLTIKSVNNGIPYIEDTVSIAENGLKEYVWVDTTIENANTLLATAKSLLNQWKVPKVSWNVSAADIFSITGEDIDKLRMGKIVRIIDEDFGVIDARIVSESKNDIKGNKGDIQLEIGNKIDSIDGAISDLQKRQEINELYSQGATNIDSHDYNDNADSDNPAEITFFLPDDLVKINKLLLSFQTSNFRAYERAIEGGGATTATSSSGGASTQTSTSGGGATVTSAGGGSSTQTSSNYIQASIVSGVPQNVVGTTNYGNHLHEVIIPGHNHTVTIPSHTHSVTVPSHTHSVSIPDHTHSVSIPDHTHAIQFGIYKLDTLPTSVVIKVDDNTVPFTDTQGDNIDLIPYLSKDSSGRVERGWHTITITPNNLGRINAQIYSQVFIQSRGQGDY